MKYNFLAMGLIATSMTAFAGVNTEPVDSRDLDVSLLDTLPAAQEPDTQGMGTFAPAPALSYLQVYAVGSSLAGGWERLSDPYAFTTTYDHGGPILRVAVLEIGYGGRPIVMMSGSQVSSSANYLNESICAFVNGVAYGCSAGQTVIGWLRYYDVSGNENGSYEHQNTSLNSPFNTMYDRIFIR